MADVVCAVLVEGDALQVFGIERVDRCSRDVGEGNADFDPFIRWDVSGVFAERERGAEAGREFGDLKAKLLGAAPPR